MLKIHFKYFILCRRFPSSSYLQLTEFMHIGPRHVFPNGNFYCSNPKHQSKQPHADDKLRIYNHATQWKIKCVILVFLLQILITLFLAILLILAFLQIIILLFWYLVTSCSLSNCKHVEENNDYAKKKIKEVVCLHHVGNMSNSTSQEICTK